MMKYLSEAVFRRVHKVSLNRQLAKLHDFLKEPGNFLQEETYKIRHEEILINE